MLINFETTGGGRARFNPNLYADGKVSALGPWPWHCGGLSVVMGPMGNVTISLLYNRFYNCRSCPAQTC